VKEKNEISESSETRVYMANHHIKKKGSYEETEHSWTVKVSVI